MLERMIVPRHFTEKMKNIVHAGLPIKYHKVPIMEM